MALPEFTLLWHSLPHPPEPQDHMTMDMAEAVSALCLPDEIIECLRPPSWVWPSITGCRGDATMSPGCSGHLLQDCEKDRCQAAADPPWAWKWIFSQLLSSSSSILIQFSESKQFPWKQSQQFPGGLGMDSAVNHWAPGLWSGFWAGALHEHADCHGETGMDSHPHSMH